MLPKSELDQLLASMNSQERLQFENRWAEPDSNYLLLFQWKLAAETLTDEEIKAKFKKLGRKDGLAKVKQKLKEQIANYLIYKMLTGKDRVFNNHFDFLFLKVLQARGIKEGMEKRAKKIQETALELGQYHTYLQTLELEQLTSMNNITELTSLFGKYNQGVSSYVLQAHLKMAIYLLNGFRRQYLFGFNHPDYWKEIKGLVQHEIFDVQIDKVNPTTALFALNVQWLYYVTAFQKAAAYNCSDAMRKIVNNNYGVLGKHEVVATLYAFKLMAAEELLDYRAYRDNYEETITTLKGLQEYYAAKKYLVMFLLEHTFLSGDQDALLKELNERDAYFMEKNLQIPHNEKLPKLLHVAGLYDGAMQYLIETIGQVYKPQKHLMAENYTRIHELMLLADMGSTAVIPSKVEAYRKWLARNIAHLDKGRAEYQVIKYFPRLYDVNGRPQWDVFKELRAQLAELGESRQPILYHFFGGMMPWLDAKIQARSYWDVVQEWIKGKL